MGRGVGGFSGEWGQGCGGDWVGVLCFFGGCEGLRCGGEDGVSCRFLGFQAVGLLAWGVGGGGVGVGLGRGWWWWRGLGHPALPRSPLERVGLGRGWEGWFGVGVGLWGIRSRDFPALSSGHWVRPGRCLPGKPRGIGAFGVRRDGLPGCRGETVSGLARMRERWGVRFGGWVGWGRVRRKPGGRARQCACPCQAHVGRGRVRRRPGGGRARGAAALRRWYRPWRSGAMVPSGSDSRATDHSGDSGWAVREGLARGEGVEPPTS